MFRRLGVSVGVLAADELRRSLRPQTPACVSRCGLGLKHERGSGCYIKARLPFLPLFALQLSDTFPLLTSSQIPGLLDHIIDHDLYCEDEDEDISVIGSYWRPTEALHKLNNSDDYVNSVEKA